MRKILLTILVMGTLITNAETAVLKQDKKTCNEIIKKCEVQKLNDMWIVLYNNYIVKEFQDFELAVEFEYKLFRKGYCD
jgi:hypothetical protein